MHTVAGITSPQRGTHRGGPPREHFPHLGANYLAGPHDLVGTISPGFLESGPQKKREGLWGHTRGFQSDGREKEFLPLTWGRAHPCITVPRRRGREGGKTSSLYTQFPHCGGEKTHRARGGTDFAFSYYEWRKPPHFFFWQSTMGPRPGADD